MRVRPDDAMVLRATFEASAGAMLETSLALRTAWTDDVARAAQQRRWDIELALQTAVPWERVATRLRELPVVAAAEPWNGTGGAAAGSGGLEVVHTYPDGGHGGFSLRAAPPDTTTAWPRLYLCPSAGGTGNCARHSAGSLRTARGPTFASTSALMPMSATSTGPQ